MLPDINTRKQSLNQTITIGDTYYDFYAFKLTRQLQLHYQKNPTVSEHQSVLDSKKNPFGKKLDIQTRQRSNSHLARKCCVDADKKPSGDKSRRNRIKLAQLQLFNQIKEDDMENVKGIQTFKKDKLLEYTSAKLKDKIKWGSNSTVERNKEQSFCRNVKAKKPIKVKERSRESLERLALGDIKLYIPSRKDYIQIYTKAIVRELLLQSNSGVKYRNPY